MKQTFSNFTHSLNGNFDIYVNSCEKIHSAGNFGALLGEEKNSVRGSENWETGNSSVNIGKVKN